LLRADPFNAAVWLHAGTAAALAGDERDAIEAWERCADLAPTSAAPLVNLALLHLGRDDVDAARDAIEEALERDPEDPRAEEVERRLGD
jgi:tetratricopeptide (TPR) repeat protein